MPIDISDVSISYAKAHSCHVAEEGNAHRKTLPFLSIVSPQNGFYEISKNDEESVIVRENECFVVSSNVYHTIVHYINSGEKLMSPKWIFLQVKLFEYI